MQKKPRLVDVCRTGGTIAGDSPPCGYYGGSKLCGAPEGFFCVNKGVDGKLGDVVEICTVLFPDMTAKFFPASRGVDYAQQVIAGWQAENPDYSGYLVDFIIGAIRVPRWKYEQMMVGVEGA